MGENKLQAKGFLVWGICALFFLYEFLLRTVIGTYQHPLMYDLNLTSFQFSVLSTTIFLLIYGCMQIPVGLIVDNIGLKKSLLIGAICCMISSFGFAYADSYAVALIYRMLMGFGASFGFICMLISVHDWMPHKYSAIFIGLSQFLGTLGPMIAAGPLESLSETTGVSWRIIFTCLGLMGFVITTLVFLFVENNNQKAGKFLVLYKSEKLSTSLLRLFKRIQPWYIAILSTCLYFTIEYLSENEGRAFLALKGISPSHAGYMITTAWIGYAIGCPLFGFLSDILERRKAILSFCSVLALISVSTFLYSPNKLYIQIAFFMLGLSASGQSIGFATVAEQFKKQFVAVGFGLNNAMIMIISAINAPTIGFFLDYARNGAPVSLDNYLLVFNVLIFIAALAIIMSIFFVKETFCKSSIDFTILKNT